MPKPSKPKGVLNQEPDDLDEEEVEEDEEEEEEEDAEEESEEEEEDTEEEAEEEDDDTPPPAAKVKKVAPKTTGKKMKKSAGLGFGIVLLEGRPIKVDVIAVRGEIAKVRKPGTDDTPTKVPTSSVRVYDEADFDKLHNRWDKINSLKDMNLTAHQKMSMFKSKGAVVTRKRRGNPLEGLL